MNVSRLLASVGGYFYSTSDDTVAVHMYGSSRAEVTVAGQPVVIRQETDYPWSGKVALTIETPQSRAFKLQTRIPGWARSYQLVLNGAPLKASLVRGYAQVDRTWTSGDRLELELPMPVERIYAHPQVRADVGRVALKRGPLVYCLEQIDNPQADVGLMRLPRSTSVGTQVRPDLFDGIVTLVADAEATPVADSDSLYRSEPFSTTPARLVAVPYYAWNNRGPNQMQVWIAES
jgi:DUF1680 family protein